MEGFVMGYSQGLNPKDFISKDEGVSRNRKGKREYLKDSITRRMMRELNEFFMTRVEIPAMKHGTNQAIETLINEEVLLLARATGFLGMLRSIKSTNPLSA